MSRPAGALERSRFPPKGGKKNVCREGTGIIKTTNGDEASHIFALQVLHCAA